MGKWDELVVFRRKMEKEDADFVNSKTWQVISFENKDLKLRFRFFLKKVR
jgi:hypothetical protein